VRRHPVAALACGFALLAGCAVSGAAVPAQWNGGAERVVLVHGLWRSSRAMKPLEGPLLAAGYGVCGIDYPSTDETPERLVELIDRALRETCGWSGGRLNFVTHSLGGVVVRAYLSAHPLADVGRVVMLAPPNRGSELVDALGASWLIRAAIGPTAVALGTSPESLPNRLGPPEFELGVIAGTRGESWLANLLAGENDGLVSVESTKLVGMRDFVTVPETHISIRRSPEVAEQVVRFLKTGSFEHAVADARSGY
jgi:triacylglycerol esterase/lipase EstA (alpha/beta hydrolase family)